MESLNESEFIEHCTSKSDCFKWHIQPNNIIEIIYRYLHSFLGDRRDYFQVLCSNSTYASIGCRKLFRLQCTLGLHMRGIGHRTHTERHAHCRSCRLQTVAMHIKARIKICTKKQVILLLSYSHHSKKNNHV